MSALNIDPSAKSPPLVIIGLDAGDPDFIQKWAEEGYLPAIASIMKRGLSGKTAGPDLISEHGAWVSLLSGISRSEHGYYYFRQLKPGTCDLETVTARDLDVLPFWGYLKGQNKKVAIIDAPDFDPMAGLPGIQLANWATHNNWDPHHFRTASEPPELLQKVRREFGARLVTVENNQSHFEEDVRLYRQLMEQTQIKGKLCRKLLESDFFDLIVTVFSASHAANHQFWKYREEIQTGKNSDHELTHAIRNVYQAIDDQIGLLLAGLPQDANIFIVSSVGMEDEFPTTGLVQAFFQQLGYQKPPLPNPKVFFSPRQVFRQLLPERWRVGLSRYFPRETRERLLADQFRRGIDWSRTKAFAIPASYTSYIRVNLRGREPEGIVESGAEYDKLLEQIEADLKQLVDIETREPAVTGVYKTVQLFNCEPPWSLPDMFVEWKPGRFMKQVLHPRAVLTQEKPDFYRQSDHSTNGFIAAAGPSIQGCGALEDIELLDLAPTFLSLLGQPVPSRLSGSIMKEMIQTSSIR